MMRLTLYFGALPLMDFGSHTLASDPRVLGPVMTFVVDLSVILLQIIY